MSTNRTSQKTVKLVETAVFMAVVVLVQLLLGGIHIGAVSISFVLIPIVLGGILIGPAGGAVLGLTFGVVTMICGITGADFFTATLMNSSTFGFIMTTLICLVKGTAAGWGAAMLFKLLKAKHTYAAVFAAAAAAPVINTGLFILGALSLSDVLAANFVAEGSTVIYFLVIGCAGINFIAEFAANLIFSPAIYALAKAATRRKI